MTKKVFETAQGRTKKSSLGIPRLYHLMFDFPRSIARENGRQVYPNYERRTRTNQWVAYGKSLNYGASIPKLIETYVDENEIEDCI